MAHGHPGPRPSAQGPQEGNPRPAEAGSCAKPLQKEARTLCLSALRPGPPLLLNFLKYPSEWGNRWGGGAGPRRPLPRAWSQAMVPSVGPMNLAWPWNHSSAQCTTPVRQDGCGLTSTKHDAGPPHAAGTTEKRGITRRGRPATGGAAPMPNSLRIALWRGAAPWVVMASERHCPEGRGQLSGAMCLSLGNPGSYPSWLSAPQPIGRGGPTHFSFIKITKAELTWR